MKLIWLVHENENYFLVYFAGPDNFEIYLNEFLTSAATISFEQPDQISNETESIPTWIKNNADWWSQRLIPDADFLKGIQFLVENGIIAV